MYVLYKHYPGFNLKYRVMSCETWLHVLYKYYPGFNLKYRVMS